MLVLYICASKLNCWHLSYLSMSRLLLSYPSWKLFRDVPKLLHFKRSCLVKLVVCLFSVIYQLGWKRDSKFNSFSFLLFLHLFQVGKASLLEWNLKNVGAVRAPAWLVLLELHTRTNKLIFTQVTCICYLRHLDHFIIS